MTAKKYFKYGDVFHLPRRQFLTRAFGATLLLGSGYILKNILWPTELSKSELHTLSAYLDTLIPADQTPSASELGVDKKIVAATLDQRLRRLIKMGCKWLDNTARDLYSANGFSSLPDAAKEHIVSLSAAEPMGNLPRIFFERLRRDAFFHYYAHPRSWDGLPYAAPPQPEGHWDYFLPPRSPLDARF